MADVSRARREGGFTIIEMIVSLTLAGVVMVSIAGVFLASLRTTGLTNRRTAAVATATRWTEAARALEYSQVGFYADQAGYVSTYEGQATVTLGATTPAGALAAGEITIEPLRTDEIGGILYTIRTHVVWEDAQGPGGVTFAEAYKRTIVIVSWEDTTGEHKATQESVVYPGGRGQYVGPQNSPTSVTSTTAAGPTGPTAPILAPATVPPPPAGETQVLLNWTQPATVDPVVRYVVQWANGPSSTQGLTFSADQPPTARSYTVTGLTAGATYNFRVFAYGSTNTPGISNRVFAAMHSSTAPAPCTLTLEVVGVTSRSTVKTYLDEPNVGNAPAQLAENLSVTVNQSGTCPAGTISVRVSPGQSNASATSWCQVIAGVPDQCRIGNLSGSSPYRASGGIGEIGWSLGQHTFTVYRGTTPTSTQKTFLVCAEGATSC